MDRKKIPPKILLGFLTTNRPDGGQHKRKCDAIYKNLRKMILNLPTTGNLLAWKNYALNKKSWGEMVNKVDDIKMKMDFLQKIV